MASLANRLSRHLRYRRARRQFSEAEGMLLSAALEKAAKQCGARDPLHFLEYLKQMRRGYDRSSDGPSHLMDLVDNISRYETEERKRRAKEYKEGETPKG